MVQESSQGDTEVTVSTDEEISTGEPQYQEPDSARDQAVENEERRADSPDEDAMVDESKKKLTPTLVSNDDLTDEDLEQEDDTEEVHSDEDHHDEHAAHHLELPDYGDYSPEALLKEAVKLLKNEPVQKIKDHFDALRKNLMKQLNEERQHKKEEFIESGGDAIDFEYIQPMREEFRKVYAQYRDLRQKHYQELREKLNANLHIKQNLIEQLKEIVNKEESIGDTFKEFNQLQQQWRNTGPVPRSESGDLYRTYHHHVENFYEYIKINKELRDLDFKKNREAKEELIIQASNLLEKEDVPTAFRALQKLTPPVEKHRSGRARKSRTHVGTI
ncbi:MAG: DUF349 domain-containing protein [Owenweeksia sp.]|nr:DUF349 domain-containing protein [Owenweeksia sp.]